MADFVPPKLYGIIGYPLGHTMSPVLHTTAFKELGVPGVMLAWPMEPEKLPAYIEAIKLLDIQGGPVTIPHKQGIIPLLDSVTDRVKAIGACNTIYRRDGMLCGDNTDVLGFMEPLREFAPAADSRVLLIGAGGAARAAVVGLQSLGITDITVTDIDEKLEAELASEFSLRRTPWDKRSEAQADIIINATPLGMKGKFEGQSSYEREWFQGKSGLAYDIVYTPFVTAFQTYAKEAGWKTISGLQMFLGQADHQCRIWTGKPMPEAARQIVIDSLSGK